MAEFLRCEECGVPERIAAERQWLNSGVVVQRGNRILRTGFLEVDNLDPLYAGIAEIIGMPIDRLIAESTRKGGRRYVQGLIPPGIQDMLRDGSLELEAVIDLLLQTAEISGYGRCELLELYLDKSFDDGMFFHVGDHVRFKVTDPYSIAPVSGVFAGACEAVTGFPFTVEYKETGANAYEIKTSSADHSDEAEERLEIKEYHYREGNIELEKCSTCGLPKALSSFKWIDDKGTIVDTRSGRRMVGVGPYIMDPLFEELEEELGDAIPRAVVESQRRFIKTGFISVEEVRDEDAYRAQLALKGMGNLREMKMKADGLRMRIENADCYLMLVGTAQALFEMAFDVDSHVEWELAGEGDLDIQVTPS